MTALQNIQNGIGWIGVGKMGNPMATRLIEAGHAVTICDPVAENRASLVARGARVVPTVAELAAGCTVVFSMIPNDEVLSEVVYSDHDGGGLLASIASGSILVEMSTVSPQLSARIGSDLARHGIRYVRCPVSGSTALARTGGLTALASGDRAGWEEVAPLIDLMATRKFFLGEAEEARYMKLVLNTLVGAMSSIVGEALALGERGGLSPKLMMDVIVESAVSSPLIRYKQEMIAQRDFSPAFSVTQMIKDFTLITDAGRDKQVPLFMVNLILQQYTAAANAGYGEQDFFALSDWMRIVSGLDEPG